MKTRIITVAAVMGLMAALSAGDLFAAGRGNSGNVRKGSGTCTNQQSATAGTALRPVGSQRRDGTFLTTGVTANGSTVRQGRGNGVMDGSRLSVTTAAPATTAQ